MSSKDTATSMGMELRNRILRNKRRLFLVALLALCLSFMIVFGYRISVQEEASLSPLIVGAGALVFLVAFVFIFEIWRLLDAIALKPKGAHAQAQASFKYPKRVAIIAGVILLICWTPILLAGYPGYFTYDSGTGWLMQWQQIESGELNAHHPVLHTLYMGFFLQLGLTLFDSFNTGVFLAVSVQAIVVATILSFSLYWLMRHGMGRFGLVASVVYLGLDPILGLFTFSTTKDVFFSALLLLYCLMLVNLFYQRSDPLKIRSYIPFVCLSAVIFALRANAIAALIIIVPLVCVILKHNRKAFLASTGAALALCALWLGPIAWVMQVEASPIGKWNMLCICEQQIARCSVDPSVTPEDKAAIEEALPGIEYCDDLSDAARKAFMRVDMSTTDLLQLYIHLGLKYPLVYWDAWLFQTQDAWSFFGSINCYTAPEETQIKTNVFEIGQQAPATRESLIPELLAGLQWISNKRGIESIPILGFIVSIPFYIFTLLFCLGRALDIRNRGTLLLLVPLFALCCTNLFGPCVLIRYYLYLFYALPVTLYTLVLPPGELGCKE